MKHSLICGLLLALGLATGSNAGAVVIPPSDNTVQPFLSTYEWGVATAAFTARNAFTTSWLSRNNSVWAEDFTATDRWDNLRGPSWQLDPARNWIQQNPNRIYIYSVGLLPGTIDPDTNQLVPPNAGIDAGVPVSLAQGAAGAYDHHWRALAQALVNKQLANNTVLRLGWEFNGTWYCWRANNATQAGQYAAYWRKIVDAVRSVAGTQNIKFCWNGNNGYTPYDVALAYPGDAYVDYIGPDLYDQSWASNTYPYGGTVSDAQRRINAWNDLSSNSNYQLGWWKTFAQNHGKKLVIPEWGCIDRPDGHGGKDNPYYIQKMYEFIHEPGNNVYFHCYFNIQGSEGNRQITPYNGHVTAFPNAAAKYQQLFKYTSVPGTSRSPVADSYVRDGTYAANNFGTGTSIEAKLDGTSFARESYLRFDVSGLANASSVKIVLIPVAAGTDGGATTLSYELVADSWTETGLTWNNRPTTGTALTSLTGYGAGQPVILDVTAPAKAQATADGQFSLRIRSTTSGAQKTVNFASREHATAAVRPVLVYTLPAGTTRSPVADSYVRDGTYAANNFGTEGSITAKLDGANFAREGYLRFDVSDLANASSIKVVLTPTAVGSDGATTTLSYELMTHDTWGETSITWNNRPTTGSILATSTGYLPGEQIELDITSQAKAQAAGDGLFTLRIRSTTSGSQRTVTFGSRENATAANRPVLEITP